MANVGDDRDFSPSASGGVCVKKSSNGCDAMLGEDSSAKSRSLPVLQDAPSANFSQYNPPMTRYLHQTCMSSS